MKKITLTLTLFVFSLGYAQQTTYNITFEPGSAGSDPNEWSTFENADGDNSHLMVENPDTSGINTSATALQMVTNPVPPSQPYAGLQTRQPGVFGSWVLDASTTTLTLMVYKEEISETNVSFINATQGTVFNLGQSNTLINTWETLTYDLTPYISNPENVNINRIVVFPDWQTRTSSNVNLIDNIVFSANAIAVATAPTDAPSTPTQDAADVISIYSDAYTDVPTDGFNQFGGATLTDEVIADNNVKKYVNLDFAGIEFTAENLIDASSKNFLHIDLWSPDGNDFGVKLVDFGADQIYQGGDDSEFEITFTAPVAGQWISYDIPLSDFTGLISTANLAQLILVKGSGTAFIDNIYFYTGSSMEPTVAAPVPSLDQSQVINMYSNSYTTDVNVSSWRSDWSTSTYTNDVQVDGSAGSEAKRYTDADFVGIEFYAPNAVDATTMNYFHVDVWSPNATVFRVKLVNMEGDSVEGEIAYELAQGEWVTLDIPLDDFADASKVTDPSNLLTSRNSIQQLIFSGQPTGTLDFYIDNVYFSTVTSLGTMDFEVNNFKVYPNPSQDSWNLSSNSLMESVTLYDLLGKQVLYLPINGLTVKIDNQRLIPGLYFALVKANGQVNSIKMLKN